MGEIVDATHAVWRHALPRVLGAPWEPRDDQLDMALSVARALERGGVLVVEAPTGIGKSLAYLVPLLVAARESGRRAAVATCTRTLQRQLATRDLPAAVEAVGGRVRGAVLMGRAAYACRRAVARMLERDDLDAGRRAWLDALAVDATGDLEALNGASEHLDGALRAAVACPPRDRACRGCDWRSECTLFEARRRALEAHVVLANQSLLMSDVAADGALLGPLDALVVDEAHHLDGVATDFLSVTVGRRLVRGHVTSVVPVDVDDRLEAIVATHPTVRAAREAFHRACSRAEQALESLFEALDAHAPGGPAQRVRCVEGMPMLVAAEPAGRALREALDDLARAAGTLREAAADEATDATFEDVAAAAREAAEAVGVVLAAADEERVFYAERRDGRVRAICAAPIDVASRLGELLSSIAPAAVLTSATLAVGDDFAYALRRFGVEGIAEAHRYASPFDLAACRRVYVAAWMPPPDAPGFAGAAARVVAEVQRRFGRRHLVLATSYAQAGALVRELDRLGSAPAGVLAQTEGGSRADLLQRFRATPGAVLVGLASFWEGIDLPGDAVEIVSVLRLPFRVPDDPVVQARAQRLREAGEDPFTAMFVPDAVLRLRQGVGRLIRTGRDRGAVLLFDRRAATARYGPSLVAAATGGAEVVDDADALVDRLRAFFDATPPR